MRYKYVLQSLISHLRCTDLPDLTQLLDNKSARLIFSPLAYRFCRYHWSSLPDATVLWWNSQRDKRHDSRRPGRHITWFFRIKITKKKSVISQRVRVSQWESMRCKRDAWCRHNVDAYVNDCERIRRDKRATKCLFFQPPDGLHGGL